MAEEAPDHRTEEGEAPDSNLLPGNLAARQPVVRVFGLPLLFVGTLLFIVGLSSPTWVSGDINQVAFGKAGLWEACEYGLHSPQVCVKTTDEYFSDYVDGMYGKHKNLAWLKWSQAMAFMASIYLFCNYVLVFFFTRRRDHPKSFLLGSMILDAATGLHASITAVLFGINAVEFISYTGGAIAVSVWLSWGFYVNIIAAVVFFLAAAYCLQRYCRQYR